MTSKNIVRAWKGPDYRSTLSASELASLPAHPSGRIELTDVDLDDVRAEDRGRQPTSSYAALPSAYSPIR
jgi:mersacidin/lichenicidin family type 2 lantibiotic